MKIKTLLFAIVFVSCSMNQANALNNLFELNSPDIKSGSTIKNQHVFNSFGCSGNNISPQISWKNPPADTQSFALTVYDPDAPTGSGWWHWMLVNIPFTYTQLPSNFGGDDKFQIKDGVTQVRNDFGNFKFGGPCPPKGDKPHRYIFTLYALKNRLDVTSGATAALAGYMINESTIAKTSFEAYYSR